MDDSRILIDRPVYTEADLITTFDLTKKPAPTPTASCQRSCRRFCSCTASAWKRRLLALFPFISIFRSYRWREWLLFDVLSGISVGAIQIPQGMGFALLAAVPPVYGLYTSFFPVIIYFFLATSRHISMGTMALTSLVIGSVVERELEKRGISTAIPGGSDGSSDSINYNNNSALQNNNNNSYYSPEEVEAIQVDVAMSISLMAGAFQLLMAVLRLSKIAMFMSKSFMGGFLNGAAVQIIGSQLLGLFGVRVKNPAGVFRVPKIIYLICRHIGETNVAALVTGLVCIAVLVVLKEVINVRCRKRMKMPIPAELIVLVVGTIISHYCRLHDRYELRVIGHIPQGMPPPAVPTLTNAGTYVGDAFVLAVISFAISFTMVRLMAEKHGYRVDADQEMLAYGVCHAVGPILNSFTGCQAPPRTLVHEAVGGRTQLASLVSSLFVFLVFMFLGPLFRSLPVPVLAGIIIVALFPLFRQFADLPELWRVSGSDFFVWIITFVTIVIFDITIGLVTGILVNMLAVLIQTAQATGSLLVNIGHADLYVSDDVVGLERKAANEGGVKVFRFEAPLFYMNAAKFKAGMLSQTASCDATGAQDVDRTTDGEHKGAPVDGNETTPTHTIVVDCSRISYVDVMGLDVLKRLHADYEKVGVRLVLADVSGSVLTKLRLAGYTTVSFPTASQLHANGQQTTAHNGRANGEATSVSDVTSQPPDGCARSDPEVTNEPTAGQSVFEIYPTVQDAVVACSTSTEYIYKL